MSGVALTCAEPQEVGIRRTRRNLNSQVVRSDGGLYLEQKMIAIQGVLEKSLQWKKAIKPKSDNGELDENYDMRDLVGIPPKQQYQMKIRFVDGGKGKPMPYNFDDILDEIADY